MEQLERRKFLIEYLLSEREETVDLPTDEIALKRLFDKSDDAATKA